MQRSQPPSLAPPRPDATEIAESLEEGTTVGQSQEVGDLFEYKLKDRVTIRKNQSALVPILQSRIDAEKVSVWNPSESSVLRALWVDNTSNLTLDGGSFNVLEGDAFAGEGLMDAIKPGEKRLLSYAADLGVLVDSKQKSDNQRVTKVIIQHGVMTQSTQERQENTYTIRNRDTAARTVVIEHPARAGWKLTDDDPKTGREFGVLSSLPPHAGAEEDHEPRGEGIPAGHESLHADQRGRQRNQILPRTENDQRRMWRKRCGRCSAQKNDIAVIDAVISGRRAEVTNISEDQKRVRENMKALKGSAEEKALVERYVRELNEQEDKVQAMRREIADLQQKRDAAQSKLNGMIESLQMDVTL